MNKPTCGPLYKDALGKYAGTDPDKIRLFAAGFVSGQAEKVYLGACRAAMFRPSADRLAMILDVIRDVANRYNLHIFHGACQTFDEIWLCRNVDVWHNLQELYATYVYNSPAWHAFRAELCGIPAEELDEAFHLRAGHGERCD
jgi:hypothetical protein